mmetsp:Transcript_37462/g.99786  ORF Transcript_37462/g.99786 Transcript_37462/m.99786 type:complete len:260 (+) Transcript_37462:648-1427(+)
MYRSGSAPLMRCTKLSLPASSTAAKPFTACSSRTAWRRSCPWRGCSSTVSTTPSRRGGTASPSTSTMPALSRARTGRRASRAGCCTRSASSRCSLTAPPPRSPRFRPNGATRRMLLDGRSDPPGGIDSRGRRETLRTTCSRSSRLPCRCSSGGRRWSSAAGTSSRPRTRARRRSFRSTRRRTSSSRSRSWSAVRSRWATCGTPAWATSLQCRPGVVGTRTRRPRRRRRRRRTSWSGGLGSTRRWRRRRGSGAWRPRSRA